MKTDIYLCSHWSSRLSLQRKLLQALLFVTNPRFNYFNALEDLLSTLPNYVISNRSHRYWKLQVWPTHNGRSSRNFCILNRQRTHSQINGDDIINKIGRMYVFGLFYCWNGTDGLQEKIKTETYSLLKRYEEFKNYPNLYMF